MARREGALVVSLDFELAWGTWDRPWRESNRGHLLRARQMVSELLDRFQRHSIHATWATVGALFAFDREELEAFVPQSSRGVFDHILKLGGGIGADEKADPLHYAPSLIEAIKKCDGQEIGSHLFTHRFCLDAPTTVEHLGDELGAAQAIAMEKDLNLRSLTFPRNQYRSSFAHQVRHNGFISVRGPAPGWVWAARTTSATDQWPLRGARTLDSVLHVAGVKTQAWSDVYAENSLANTFGGVFFRFSTGSKTVDSLQLMRLRQWMRKAAESGAILHVYWHPHNLARYPEDSLRMLDMFIREYELCRNRFGFRSLNMDEVAHEA